LVRGGLGGEKRAGSMKFGCGALGSGKRERKGTSKNFTWEGTEKCTLTVAQRIWARGRGSIEIYLNKGRTLWGGSAFLDRLGKIPLGGEKLKKQGWCPTVTPPKLVGCQEIKMVDKKNQSRMNIPKGPS